LTTAVTSPTTTLAELVYTNALTPVFCDAAIRFPVPSTLTFRMVDFGTPSSGMSAAVCITTSNPAARKTSSTLDGSVMSHSRYVTLGASTRFRCVVRSSPVTLVSGY
jgi:hypothetical protein